MKTVMAALLAFAVIETATADDSLLIKKFLITYKVQPRLTIGTILYLWSFKVMENGHVKESNTVPERLQFNGVIPRLRP